MIGQYTLQQYAPFHPAPATLQHNQPILAQDFVVYSEWSYGENKDRFPRNDQDADVLVGDNQIRYLHWYISGGRDFFVSNDDSLNDSRDWSKFHKINRNEVLRFVSKVNDATE